MNDDIGLIDVNVISLFYESGNYRGLCWPGVDHCYLLSLAWTPSSSRIRRPSFTRQLLTSHSATRVMCVYWTH